MARKKKRMYGTGGAGPRHSGVTLRWREKVIQPDGTVKIVHRSKAAGKISQRDATDQLRDLIAATKTPTVAPVLFKDHAASWKALILPKYPKHSTRKHHEDIVVRARLAADVVVMAQIRQRQMLAQHYSHVTVEAGEIALNAGQV